jgi:thioredoxin
MASIFPEARRLEDHNTGNGMKRRKGMADRNDFDRMIGAGITLADFMAPWCDPCHSQDAILEQVKRRFEGRVHVVEVDIDKNRDVALDFGIQSIPTIILFKGGREINRFIGIQTADRLDRALKRALGIKPAQ